MHLLIIDDVGTFWRGVSGELRAAFDSPFSGGEFVEYAVKHLGFVAINIYGASCQVRLRPESVTRKALGALRSWWGLTKADRVVLSTFADGRKDELLHPRKLAECLDRLFASEPREKSSDFLAKPLAPTVLRGKPVIADVLASWPHIVHQYEAETLLRLLRSAFEQCYVVVNKSENDGRFVFKEFGDAMFPTYETWRTVALGAPIEEQPDRAYGRWIGQVYRDSEGSMMPRLEAVDAIIACPIRGRVRRRYQRLIFPFAASSPDALFFGGTLNDCTVDLRITAQR